MADVTKRFRWGSSVEEILDQFTTPEINTLRRHCRKLIRDFCDLEIAGEGYRCAIIPFEMFHYGFVLAYASESDEWVLDVFSTPALGDPGCPRKRPRKRKDGGARREIAKLLRRHKVLYKTLNSLRLKLTATWVENTVMRGFARLKSLLRRVMRLREHGRASPYILLFNAFAEQQSQGCKNVVQLVRLKVNEALSYIGPVSSYVVSGRRADNLWDTSLFGVAEPASG
ncbi:MAG: hypothetical protein H7124_03085 [Phycisphaerales bacterium]|nr:hypothetical protein [Hyphomonadaceae bacterium]